MDAGTVTDPKIGYVGAYPYAEVVCGYTAFLLGIQSIVPEAYMEVQYTSSWYDLTAEGEAANQLMADGCVIIGQHADSTGAPSAVQAKKDAGEVVYSVGYNIDMLEAAPTAAPVSYTHLIPGPGGQEEREGQPVRRHGCGRDLVGTGSGRQRKISRLFLCTNRFINCTKGSVTHDTLRRLSLIHI